MGYLSVYHTAATLATFAALINMKFGPNPRSSANAAIKMNPKAAFGLPGAIETLACEPEKQKALTEKWDETVKLLDTATAALTKALNAKPPADWTSEDKEEFKKNVEAFLKDAERDKAICTSRSGTVGQTSLEGKVMAYAALTLATTALTIAMVLLAIKALPGVGTAAAGIKGWLANATLEQIALNLLNKRVIVISAAAAIFAAGEAWHITNAAQLDTKVNDPHGGGEATFNLPEANWEKKLNEKAPAQA
ncbi:hypothetical protein [Nonomuraea sp. NPDC003804]|uniref:hypothetical protein n=1 Tax=Nonomuraea sp. NPDC003804 TaxID=3154547 RepID=UPI0033A56549